MTQPKRGLCGPVLLALGLAASLGGCREEVPLGAWDSQQPEAVGSGGNGASTVLTNTVSSADTSTTGGGAALPSCLAAATPGAFNAAGSGLGATEMASDWTWPAPVASMQWDLMVEREIERPSPEAGPTSGYYYAYQFSFLEGASGFLGIQAEGGYQLEPPDSPVEFTKIAVFWLSGPPLAAELGDIAYPDARVAPETVAGVSYLTIHARFDWQVCHTYRFRVAPHSSDADGIWYGAWIEDTQSGVETFLGRMLLPADAGPLAPFSVSRSLPIEFGAQTCDVPAPSSVLFGRPHTLEGDVQAELERNRFVDPGCPSSRFTDFVGAVRHELGAGP